MINFELNKAVSEKEILAYGEKVSKINKMINEKTGAGNDFLGWVDWPVDYDKEELKRLLVDAKYVRDNFEILVVCGIGGSYLGARCALEALKGIKSNDKLEVIFMGQTFSPNYTKQVLDYLQNKKFAINVMGVEATGSDEEIAIKGIPNSPSMFRYVELKGVRKLSVMMFCTSSEKNRLPKIPVTIAAMIAHNKSKKGLLGVLILKTTVFTFTSAPIGRTFFPRLKNL